MNRRIALLSVCLLLAAAALAYAGSRDFILGVCLDECGFRCGVRYQYNYTPILPDDAIKRDNYIKCTETCHKRVFEDDDPSLPKTSQPSPYSQTSRP